MKKNNVVVKNNSHSRLQPLGMTSLLNGFTLIELLVVVLIIGILAAVAVPQYQKAVLKSRYSAMMPIGKAIADGNEVYYMEHGAYASLPTELDIAGQSAKYPDGTQVSMPQEDESLSYVLVTNDSVPNARYLVYQKHSENFPDTTWCEAGDDRANELCQALGGVIPDGVSGNSGMDADWTAYLLSGEAKAGDTFGGSGAGGADTPAALDAETLAKLQAVSAEKCPPNDKSYECIINNNGTVTRCVLSLASIIEGKCVPKTSTITSKGTIETTYDIMGDIIESFTCGPGCTKGYFNIYTLDTINQKVRTCANNAAIDNAGTCSDANVYASGYDEMNSRNPTTQLSKYTCKANSDCSEYTSMKEYNYDTGATLTRTCKDGKIQEHICTEWGEWK